MRGDRLKYILFCIISHVAVYHHNLVSVTAFSNTNHNIQKACTSRQKQQQLLRRTIILHESKPSSESTASRDPIGNVALLLPSGDYNAANTTSLFGRKSPVEPPSILTAAQQLVNKIQWFSDDTIQAKIFTADDDVISDEIKTYDAVIALHLTSEQDVHFASKLFASRLTDKTHDDKCQFALQCAADDTGLLDHTLVGPYDSSKPSLSSRILPWSPSASGKRMRTQMQQLFDRWTSDDFVLALLLFFNQFSGSKVPWVEHSIDATWEKGLIRNTKEFYGMVTNCGGCVSKCLADENCKQCIDALNAVDTRDQVASYRTVVSFESELLRDFSYCILQKNNVFGCNASIPTLPYVPPMKTWRGHEITAEDARQLLIGHLDDPAGMSGSLKLNTSWKVACGANVAYDQFPSQNQIFYENSAGRDMWYDPIFRVETIDGRTVWAKRHYKVKQQTRIHPATFRFSVLDNGVTSNEYWTIAGAADDLSWIVFHYAGAASAVGQRYIGGLLCTADGSVPSDAGVLEDIWCTLRGAGIEPWELFVVNNDEGDASVAGPAPLDYFRKDVLRAKEERRAGAAEVVG